MKKILTGALAIAALLGASSCSSDKSSSSDTTTASADSTADSSADTTAGSTDGSAADTTLRDQAIAVMIAGPPAGVTFDDACFTDAMAGLSDADAQLIVDGGPTASPVLSAEGTALATAAVASCGALTPTT